MKKTKTITLSDKPHKIYPFNAQHIGRREEQQDYFTFSNIFDDKEVSRIGAVSILADGMGGMKNGRVASKTAVEVFMQSYQDENCDISDIGERLINAAHAANKAVNKLSGAGSTLCAVVIKDWQLHWLSIGDSRIYLYRNGSIRQINKEHNFAAVLDEQVKNGEITRAAAINDPRSQMLTSYLGIPELEEIDIVKGIFPLFLGDSIMICSDGLYRELSDDEISYILANGDESVCEDLVNAALAKEDINQDNITVTLMDID